jgi:hypothetical protein
MKDSSTILSKILFCHFSNANLIEFQANGKIRNISLVAHFRELPFVREAADFSESVEMTEYGEIKNQRVNVEIKWDFFAPPILMGKYILYMVTADREPFFPPNLTAPFTLTIERKTKTNAQDSDRTKLSFSRRFPA